MNQVKRKQLRDASSYLAKAIIIIEQVCEKETDSMDNYPESLQQTDAYEKMEDAVDRMESAVEVIEESRDLLESIVRKIHEGDNYLQEASM